MTTTLAAPTPEPESIYTVAACAALDAPILDFRRHGLTFGAHGVEVVRMDDEDGPAARAITPAPRRPRPAMTRTLLRVLLSYLRPLRHLDIGPGDVLEVSPTGVRLIPAEQGTRR